MTAALMLRFALMVGLLPSFALATVLTPPLVSHPADQNPVPVPGDCEHTDTAFRCITYHSNYDGDTLTVSIPKMHPLFGKRVSVRVFGVDAPEMHSDDACERDAAIEAQRLVKSMLIQARRIDLQQVQRDKYFRVLADVMADGRSVASALIARGLAYPYFGGTKQRVDWCAPRSAIID